MIPTHPTEKIKSAIVFIIDLACFEGPSWYRPDDGVGTTEAGLKRKQLDLIPRQKCKCTAARVSVLRRIDDHGNFILNESPKEKGVPDKDINNRKYSSFKDNGFGIFSLLKNSWCQKTF